MSLSFGDHDSHWSESLTGPILSDMPYDVTMALAVLVADERSEEQPLVTLFGPYSISSAILPPMQTSSRAQHSFFVISCLSISGSWKVTPRARPRGKIVALYKGVAPSVNIAAMAWPASCTRHSCRCSSDHRWIDLLGDCNVLQMVFKDGQTASDVRQVNVHHLVKSSRSSQSLIQGVWEIGGSNDDDSLGLRKSIQLNEQLVQRLLGVGLVSALPLSSDGVELIDENNSWGSSTSFAEQFPDSLGTHTNIQLVELGSRHEKERHTSLAGSGPRKQRLTGTRGAGQQNTLWKLSTESGKLRRILQKLNDFLELGSGLVNTTHIGKLHGRLADLHALVLDTRALDDRAILNQIIKQHIRTVRCQTNRNKPLDPFGDGN
ncbi:hypothetical protein OGATHE_001336 [Ogataea polymorpha]|uniref:Uncharacterized protein n=1 Tax=Ogataea polymorpha TaxID=460523 RepID=A0A9P8TFD5_9ASCO|nr:hypothetical protein OGATHE_001336 [Ogataea polymorpha]